MGVDSTCCTLGAVGRGLSKASAREPGLFHSAGSSRLARPSNYAIGESGRGDGSMHVFAARDAIGYAGAKVHAFHRSLAGGSRSGLSDAGSAGE